MLTQTVVTATAASDSLKASKYTNFFCLEIICRFFCTRYFRGLGFLPLDKVRCLWTLHYQMLSAVYPYLQYLSTQNSHEVSSGLNHLRVRKESRTLPQGLSLKTDTKKNLISTMSQTSIRAQNCNTFPNLFIAIICGQSCHWFQSSSYRLLVECMAYKWYSQNPYQLCFPLPPLCLSSDRLHASI